MNHKELLPIIRQAVKDKQTWLDLSNKNLTSLPPEIGRLQSLHWLDLSKNQVLELPSEIGQLQNLTSLNLRENCLTSLPTEIGQLQNLTSLDLSKNQFKSLTLKIARLKSLTLLNLSENYLTALPSCVTQLPDLTWLYINGNRLQSLRAEIAQLQNLIKLHLGNNRLTDLPEAITLLQNLTELHINGNPLDLPAEILERSPQAEPILNFYRQLQEDGENGLFHDGKRLPRNWIKVRRILEKHPSNYITQEEYFKICQQNGFTQIDDKLELSRYLHKLEVCRHFQDDLGLEQVIILKLSWITDAFDRVLRSDRIISTGGKFHEQDLTAIWSEGELVNMRWVLLRLMMNSNLCYETSPKNYLIPQLLSSKKPEYEWDQSSNLTLQYEYELMPKELFTRFIVEIHRLIEQKSCVWQSGVVLSEDQTRAEVIETYHPQRGEIKIRISGKRRESLRGIIISTFNDIHLFFDNLQPKKLVPCNCNICQTKQTPHFYRFEHLRQFLDDKHGKIQCYISCQMVNISELLGEADWLKDDQPQDKDKLKKEVFISYAWEAKDEGVREMIEKLCKTFQERGVQIIRDTEVILYKEDIQVFMERIGRGKCVIAIISDEYLKSKNCMFELVQTAKSGQFNDRIFPVVLPSAKIHDPEDRAEYIIHWQNKCNDLQAQLDRLKSSANLSGLYKDRDLYEEIRSTIDRLVDILKNMATLPGLDSEAKFDVLFEAIERKLAE
jgi:internalin A